MREEIYTYDAFGNRTAYITPPEQPAHTFDYTEVDLTDSYTPPAVPDSAGGINYLYDKDKKLLQTVFSDSSSIQMVYDTTFSGSSRPIAINYDQGSTAFAYDSTTGNLTSVVSSDSVVTNYSYDGSLTTQLSAQGPVSGTIHYTHDNDFRVTSQILNGADTLAFSYSDDGLITKAGELSLSYDSQNRLLTADTLGQVTGSYGYNGFGELTGTTYRHNASDLYDRSFTHDSVGRLTSLTEVIEGDTTQYEYAYNDIGYLIEVKEDGAVTAEYQYDSNGNRTAYITPTDTVTATYDEQDRMLSYGNASYEYGKRGNLQKKIVATDTTIYNYDNVGNLRSVVLPDGTLIEYVIDGSDRRVAKKINGAVVKHWLYASGLLPVAELDSTDNIKIQYGPGYIVKNDTTYWVIKDHLGSVRMIVNAQTGNVVQQINYDAYGNITYLQNPDEFIDIGFAGGLYDKDTGLIRFGARDYDPEIGRWTSKDPILFDGGTSNLYEYVFNDPVNRTDINGLQPCGQTSSQSGLFSNTLASLPALAITTQLDSPFLPFADIVAGAGLLGMVAYDAYLIFNPASADQSISFADGEDATFPDEGELARELGVPRNKLHEKAKEIKEGLKDFGDKIGSHNPDIGISPNGDIVLKHPVNKRTIDTKIPLDWFKD